MVYLPGSFEEVKQLEQTCMGIKKMITTLAVGIAQLRSISATTDSPTDQYTRKFLEDNEANVVKFMGRYLREKEKLIRLAYPGIPVTPDIFNYPTLIEWLQVISVSQDLLDAVGHSLPLQNASIEDVLKSPSLSETFGSFHMHDDAALALSSLEKLKMFINCLVNDIVSDPRSLVFSRPQEPIAQPKPSKSGLLAKRSNSGAAYAARHSEAKVQYKTPQYATANTISSSNDVSSSSHNIHLLTGPGNSVISRSNASIHATGEANGRPKPSRLSEIPAMRRRRHFFSRLCWDNSSTSKRPQTNGNVPNHVASVPPQGKASTCLIHVFDPKRIFVAKCHLCRRVMAFRCQTCSLCGYSAHINCANSLPHVNVKSFASGRPSGGAPLTQRDGLAPLPQPQREMEFAHDTQAGSISSSSPSKQIVTPHRSLPLQAVLMSPISTPQIALQEQQPPPSPPRMLSGTPVSSTITSGHYPSAYLDSTGSNSGCFVLDASSAAAAEAAAAYVTVGNAGQFGSGEGIAVDRSSRYVGNRMIRPRTSILSTLLREWSIPLKEIMLEPDPISTSSRFTTVYHGWWHGDVAVKVIECIRNSGMNGGDASEEESEAKLNDHQLQESFKDEVSILAHTRHENLALFMGASMEQQKLVIVTGFCKGKRLDQLIYPDFNGTSCNNGYSTASLSVPTYGPAMALTPPPIPTSSTSTVSSGSGFSLSPMLPSFVINTARQIAQAVAYLHSKGILHKNLNSRNVFVENNGRVVLSDFGVFNVTRLAANRDRHDAFIVSKAWLLSLAPELAKRLTVSKFAFSHKDMQLKFTEGSDTFAFGCIWHELLHRRPAVIDFRSSDGWSLPTHCLLLQRGRGILPGFGDVLPLSPPACGLPAAETHRLLAACWAEEPSERPTFSPIVQFLNGLATPRNLLGTSTQGISSGLLSVVPSSSNSGHPLPTRSPSQPIKRQSKSVLSR